MDYFRIASILLVLTPVFVLRWELVKARLVGCISGVLNMWLSGRHMVRHVETAAALPSTDYCFPNGQGDAEKFLRGRENSLLWERNLGSIYRIWSGMTPEIVLTTPGQIREVFKDSDRHIKAVNNNSGYFLGELLGQCVGLISGDEWKRLRAVTEKAFVQSQSVSYSPLVCRRTAQHFQKLQATSALASGSINPAADLKMLPFWIVAEIIYGPLRPDEEQVLAEIAPAREKLWRNVLHGGLTRFAWSKYLPTAANRDLDSFKSRWTQFNRRIVARLAFDGGRAPIADMFREVDVGTVSEQAILQTLDEALFANLDVTLGGISWNLVYLAAYPTVQQRLRGEIAEEQKQGGRAALERYIQRSSSYLTACIAEASRLRPLAAFSVPQAVPTARVVDGYLFPAGTNFVVDAYAVNQRNRAYWGKDSERYRPDRFLEDGQGSLQGRYSFWRFGFGPRQCMGRFVADLAIRAILVHLVENYTLSTSDSDYAWQRDPENWINHPDLHLRCQARPSVAV